MLQGCYASVPALLHGFILREIVVRSITEYFRPYLRLKLHILSVTLHSPVTRVLQGCYVSVPALLHGFILREIVVRSITEYFRPYLRLKLHILSVTLHSPVTRVLQGCYVTVPARLHGFILREIDVTLITQYFWPYLRLKLHILSVTLLLQGRYRAVT